LTRVGNLEASTVSYSLLKRIRKTGTLLSGNQAAVDRVRRVAVEDLVLSQDKPKKAPISCEISHETAILRSSVHKIIYRDLQLKSSNASNDVVLSCCLKPIPSPFSLADK